MDEDNRKESTAMDASPEALMNELRQLILGPEKEQLETLQGRLDDPSLHAADVSRILPEAIVLGARTDSKLTTALMPTVEKIVATSVRKDIRTFADALFPVIGPAIRKSISETFKQMIQSLNNALEMSFSWNGLKWRIESARTGRPFAEIVLLHNLLYRVDQVFLIHRKTGLLLENISAKTEAFQDADLVSGMLTAIEDFVRDSFNFGSHQALETVQVGEFTLWIEQGPSAILAGAIRGNAPEELRTIFHGALENIHLEYSEALDAFDGETAPFEATRHHLETCLQAQYKEKKRKFSPLLILIVLGMLIALGAGAFWSIRDHLRWERFLETLESEPGIVITHVRKSDGVFRINGLRDPLAADPVAILARSAAASAKVVYRLEPYQALLPEFTLQRAQKMLAPPETVSLSLEGDTLKAMGSAPHRWITDARKLAQAVPGVVHFDDRGLIDADLESLHPPDSVSLKLENGTLTATGPAPHSWIIGTRSKVKHIRGIVRYDDSGLVDRDMSALLSLKADMEKEVFLFEFNTAEHAPDQMEAIGRILAKLNRLLDLALIVDWRPYIELIGHTDTSGTTQRNTELSLNRAKRVRDYLLNGGIDSEIIGVVGVGASDPVREGDTEQDKAWNRSVTFKIYLQ